ncbi:uncharacterized protein LOC117924009 [Vitis riparia]|uniref:uncharacterized protein LOC117924009 n=1 Tax=Vitis riparia TaxID=96939 RepID=UPI00155AE4EE|nr:uncharacterized protein LOC117924009 [Vitis riparia]
MVGAEKKLKKEKTEERSILERRSCCDDEVEDTKEKLPPERVPIFKSDGGADVCEIHRGLRLNPWGVKGKPKLTSSSPQTLKANAFRESRGLPPSPWEARFENLVSTL